MMENIKIQVRGGTTSTRASASPYDSHSMEATYLIEGSDGSGSIRQLRVYTEFLCLRDLLQYRWPGFILPFLPLASVYPLALSSVSEETRQSLEKFLIGLTRQPLLYKSTEMQVFLRHPRHFEFSAEGFRCKLDGICTNYSESFPDYAAMAFSQELFEELKQYGGFLQRTERDFSQLSEKIQAIHKSHDLFEKEYLQLLGMLEHPEDSEVEQSDHQQTNEYEVVRKWAESEHADLRTVIDAILRILELEEKRNKLLVRQEKEQLKLAKGKEGRVSFTEIFGANKTKILEKIQKNIDDIVEKIRVHDKVMNIAVRILFYEELPKFKHRKKARYLKMLASFSDFALNYYRSLIEVIQFKFTQYLKT